MKRRELLQFSSAGLILLGSPAWAQTKLGTGAPKKGGESGKLTFPVAINKAGKQRMLSQRMAKCYAQIGCFTLSDRCAAIMNDSIGVFERHLGELHEFAPNESIRQLYAEQERLLERYKIALAATPTKEGGADVLNLSEEVLKNANLATLELEKASGTNLGKLVNIAGRQRMLSQRTAKFYFFKELGLADSAAVEIAKNKEEFKTALATLKAATEATPEIKSQLGLAETQWPFFELALDVQKKGSTDPDNRRNVATTSERILEVFETVTGLFERVS